MELKNKSVNYIRSSWILFFKKKGYLPIESSSLVPNDDPSLLWINSGVAALKKYFNNPSLSPAKNLVNCQNVIRTNDIERIDKNSYHQTLFEMLGCFSIDGNFKREIIPLIWEFFTSPNFLKIDPKNLFITVLETDSETFSIWKSQPGIFSNNIILGKKASNFWDMGDGPCGPNSEIYYCFSVQNEKIVTMDDLENKDFIEIINIVFSEFYHRDNQYLPLSKKCVDVGAGLERIALVLQGVQNTFQIDIWKNSIDWLKDCCKKNNFDLEDDDIWKLYVISDHLRTLIFAISDGVLPEHKKRGYILKKLLKKIALLSYSLKLKVDDVLILHKIIVLSNSDFYNKIIYSENFTKNLLGKELSKLNLKFKNDFEKIEQFLKLNLNHEISAQNVFFWYDTDGIPLEIIYSVLKKYKISFDESEFKVLLEEQKIRSFKERSKKRISTFGS